MTSTSLRPRFARAPVNALSILLPDLFAIVCGSLVGFSLALIGGGGSILATPLLLYVVGVRDPHLAIGTSAVAVAINAFANLIPHARAGHVRWKVGFTFAATGVIGALVGSTIGKAINGQHLLALFALLMLVVAALMLRGRRGGGVDRYPLPHMFPRLGAVGFAAGGLSGFFGIGGGFLIVPGLMLASGMATGIELIGTSLFSVGAFAITTALNYAASGLIDWRAAAGFIAGGIVGGWLRCGCRAQRLARTRGTAATCDLRAVWRSSPSPLFMLVKNLAGDRRHDGSVGVIYVLLSVICSVLVSVLLKLARRFDVDAGQAIAWNYVVAGALTALLLQSSLASLREPGAPWLALAGLGVLLPTIFLALGASVRHAGIVRSDAAQRPEQHRPSLLAAFVLFGEQLSGLKAAGIALGLLALLCMVWRKGQGTADSGNAGWLYPLLVLGGFGAIDILFKRVALAGVPLGASLQAMFALALLVAFALQLWRRLRGRTHFTTRSALGGVALGSVNFGNILFYLRGHRALPQHPAARSAKASRTIGVVALKALVGVLVFQERLSRLNLGGVLLAPVSDRIDCTQLLVSRCMKVTSGI